ncbi:MULTISPECIES: ATP-binding protein [unclassified Kitasatospora]|uniref:ATP-binding protein n=1 Tax=unclassified Kitasatospora TaxID=2633591 RepID=UPI00070BAAB1|nr:MULTISPECIES: ATP-binding protein [unclassified Kitasatospora]KQV12034.1 hypothetical protein ASC99_34955 [Kitasatospora sp. Root107]KRB72573.1 hypothetical protein ASE03_22295 [Kitasatospora sp. Root187]
MAQQLNQWQRAFDASPESVSVARHELRRVLAGWGWEGGPLDDAVLICSELVANAIVHTAPGLGDEIRVRVQESEGDCRIEVLDSRPDLMPVTPTAAPSGEGGRGLLLVRACAADMDVVTTRGRKKVWARVLREAAA